MYTTLNADIMYITAITEKLCSFNQRDEIEIGMLNEFSSVKYSYSLFFQIFNFSVKDTKV